MFDRRAKLALFWPLLIEQLLSTTVAMLGTFMVSSIGEFAMGGVGLVDTINLLATGILSSTASGVTVVVAQCLGRGQDGEAGKASMQSLIVIVLGAGVVGALLTVSRAWLVGALFSGVEPAVAQVANDYLLASSVSLPLLAVFNVVAGVRRAEGDSRSPMFGALFANVAYLVVAWAGIHWLHLGVLSLCAGMIASRIVSACIMLSVIAKHPKRVALPRFRLHVDAAVLRPVMAVAMPLGIDTLFFNGFKVLVGVFMSGMGTPALAANAISGPVFSYVQLPGRAYQLMMVTVVGQTFGAGDYRAAWRHAVRISLESSVTLLATVALYFVAQDPLLNFFHPSPETKRIAVDAFFWAFIFTPIAWSASFVTPSALRAMGHARYSMWASIVSMVLVRVVFSWVLGVALHGGLTGIFWAMVLDWIVRGLCYGYKLFAIRPSACSAALSPSTAADKIPPA